MVHRAHWGINEIIFWDNGRMPGSDIIEFEKYVLSFGEKGAKVIEAKSRDELWFRAGGSYDPTRNWWKTVHKWVAMYRGDNKRLNLANNTWYVFEEPMK